MAYYGCQYRPTQMIAARPKLQAILSNRSYSLAVGCQPTFLRRLLAKRDFISIRRNQTHIHGEDESLLQTFPFRYQIVQYPRVNFTKLNSTQMIITIIRPSESHNPPKFTAIISKYAIERHPLDQMRYPGGKIIPRKTPAINESTKQFAGKASKSQFPQANYQIIQVLGIS